MIRVAGTFLWLGLGASLGLAGCNESWTKHFENVDAAKKEGLIDKGWIPPFIPQDATDIVVSGDLDSAIVVGSFISKDSDNVGRNCSNAPDSFRVPYYAIGWLESTAVADTAGALKSKGYELFECADAFDLAYRKSMHHYYYWNRRRK